MQAQDKSVGIVYMDYAASTPCDASTVEAMLPFFNGNYANASNLAHSLGIRAREAVDHARSQVAELLDCEPQEIIWTSGATESNNLAIEGVAKFYKRTTPRSRNHVITAASEHKSVLAVCRSLEEEGFEITRLKPTSAGIITAAMVEEALRADTFLVSIMGVNNELGTINEIFEIGARCRARNIIAHSDCTQLIGKMKFSAAASNLDLISFSGHKLYAPKGTGALFVRSNDRGPIPIEPLIKGGGQEGGLRSGSLNVPGIVGLGVACKSCLDFGQRDIARIDLLRTQLERRIVTAITEATINGFGAERAPHISSITFPIKIKGIDLIKELTDVACSSGSACSSEDSAGSHVLRSIGLKPHQARSTLRLSLGRQSTEEDVRRASQHIIETVERLNQ